MAAVEFGEPIPIPENFTSHIIVNPPTYKYVNTCEHQGEPVRVTTEEGQEYLFKIGGYQNLAENSRLYKGSYRLADETQDPPHPQMIAEGLPRDEGLVEEGNSFLLILNEGTAAHDAEIWIEEKTFPYKKNDLLNLFQQMIKANSADDFARAMRLPDTSELSLSDMMREVGVAIDNNDVTSLPGICFSTMLKALQEENWNLSYLMAETGFRASLYNTPEFLSSVITIMLPFWIYLETHNPDGTQISYFLESARHTNEAKSQLGKQTPKEKIETLMLANAAVGTLIERSLKINPQPGVNADFSKAIAALESLEEILGLTGLRDWFVSNSEK